MAPEVLAEIVNAMQDVPTAADRVARAAATVIPNGRRVAEAARLRLEFDDSPGDFVALLSEGGR
jgi:hypothetical protein